MRGFDKEGKNMRFAKMWARGLMAAIKLVIPVFLNSVVRPASRKENKRLILRLSQIEL